MDLQQPVPSREKGHRDLHDGRGELTLEQMPQEPSTPLFPMHELLPKLTLLERTRLDCLTSFNFAEFQNFQQIQPAQAPISIVVAHPEKHILYKGFRILERRVFALVNDAHESPESKIRPFLCFLKLGHICLLAGDNVRALSAYQRALDLRSDLFWRDPAAQYGLGIVYLHFRSHRNSVRAFSELLYSNPNIAVAADVHARLGVAYRCIGDHALALKHFKCALHDARDSAFLPKAHLKLNVALCYDSAGDISKAYQECQQLLHEENASGVPSSPQSNQLRAAILRELGWLCYRMDSDFHSEARRMKLVEAEQHLSLSKQIVPESGKTYYYLGRCYGEQTPHRMPDSTHNQGPSARNYAHEAFVHYRFSIDKSEADADTWCSIGVLYSQQQQPMDALQAYVCAVDLDPEHTAGWANLGQLYEQHAQYTDALACYKKAMQYSATVPEQLRARVALLEKELALSPVLNQPPQTPARSANLPHNQIRLPALKDAGAQPIPSELRQRQEEFLRIKQNRYRTGSLLWSMPELAHQSPALNYGDPRPLDSTALNMLRLLKQYSKNDDSKLCDMDRLAIQQLEQRHQFTHDLEPDAPPSEWSVQQDPATMSTREAVRHFTSVFEWNPEAEIASTSAPGTKEPKKEEPDAEEEQKPSTSAPSPLATDGHPLIQKTSELPHTFSLLAPLRVPLDVTAKEVQEAAHRRTEAPDSFIPLFDERVPPPMPPAPPPPPADGKADYRQTPVVMVESRKDAHALELQRFCETAPVAVIRGLTAQLKMDLSLFSTKSMTEVAPDLEVEVATQYKQPPDGNVDHIGRPTWKCDSTRAFTTVRAYADYQMESFKCSLKEESDRLRAMSNKYGPAAERELAARKRKQREDAANLRAIKYGMAVDLSDDTKFKAQLTELAKMPPVFRVIAGCNLLSHLGHTVYGMNTVQMQMKVPGSRSPGRIEHNALCSVSINIGPGEVEWFGTPYEYWGEVQKKCLEQGVDFVKGTWWPSADDLLAMGVPVYRFTQKAGDLVWIGAGFVHWSQSTGWCNSVSWCVGPLTPGQLSMAVHQYECNRLASFKSLIPMQHLFWQIAKNVRVTNQKVYSIVRGQLIRSMAYCKMLVDWAERQGKTVKIQPRANGEITHYCHLCDTEVFNILWVREENTVFTVSCVSCARRAHLVDYIVLQQFPFLDLSNIFDAFQLHMISRTSLVV